MTTYFCEAIRELRAHPREGLINSFITAEIDGDRLTDEEIIANCIVTMVGGQETTTNLIGNGVLSLLRNPDQLEKLRSNLTLIPSAVEELLRYEAPSQYQVRRSMKEVHLHGTAIPEGMPVFLINGAANRDHLAWTDADKFDIDRDRSEAQNLGLGYGIHSCLGAALARMESAIALDKLLDFMPRFEVDFDNCNRVQMQNVMGWKNVPVKCCNEQG
jgi:cytochrome P450